MKWYNQAIPRVRDFKSSLCSFAQSNKKYSFVLNTYVFNENIQKFQDKNYRVKDIDILALTELDSGDLLAIDNNKDGALQISTEDLEDLGFDKNAVFFTKNMLQHKLSHMDFWVGSSDNKLLHWGTISETLEDWYKIKKEAELKAEFSTNMSKFEIVRASEDLQQKWNEIYDSYMIEYTKDCPQGWYVSDNALESILKHSIAIQDMFKEHTS